MPLALLHTTNLYPTPVHLVRYGALKELSEAFPSNVYGLSDHTITNHACFGAVALGAECIEFHITDDRASYGTDQSASIEAKNLKSLSHISGLFVYVYKDLGHIIFDE